MCPTRWLAWQLTDGGGRILGGLVAIGDKIAGDEPTLTGDHPAVDAVPAIVLFQQRTHQLLDPQPCAVT
jgi:hypothetical protein